MNRLVEIKSLGFQGKIRGKKVKGKLFAHYEQVKCAFHVNKYWML